MAPRAARPTRGARRWVIVIVVPVSLILANMFGHPESHSIVGFAAVVGIATVAVAGVAGLLLAGYDRVKRSSSH